MKGERGRPQTGGERAGTRAPVEDTYWWYAGVYALIARTLDLCAGARPLVMDAGCGRGALARALGARTRTVSVDIAADALADGRRVGTADMVRARLEALPFADECFDAAVSVDVLSNEGCCDKTALAEMRRVLKPGGMLLLNLPACQWLKGPHDYAIGNRRRYSAREVGELLAETGFLARRITYRNTLLFPVACVSRLAQKLLLRTAPRNDVGPLPGWLNGLLLALLRAENRLIGWCRLPFGLSVFAMAVKPGRT